MRIVRSEPAAEDLLQEVFLRVWTRADQWTGEGTVRAWLLAIATNLALNHLRDAFDRSAQFGIGVFHGLGNLPDEFVQERLANAKLVSVQHEFPEPGDLV